VIRDWQPKTSETRRCAVVDVDNSRCFCLFVFAYLATSADLPTRADPRTTKRKQLRGGIVCGNRSAPDGTAAAAAAASPASASRISLSLSLSVDVGVGGERLAAPPATRRPFIGAQTPAPARAQTRRNLQIFPVRVCVCVCVSRFLRRPNQKYRFFYGRGPFFFSSNGSSVLVP